MTAPTTRETADHAELKRLAEAATRGDWRAHITTKRSPEIYTNVPPPNTPNPKIAGAVLRKADARFIAAANPARVLSLLSEIAAPRGEVAQSKREYRDDVGKHIARAAQAKRQRDEARKAMREAAAALRDLTEWRDISSAPKDGTEFQVWWSGQWQPRARFNPETEAFELWGRIDYDHDGWDAFSLDLADGWLPLPSAPNQAKEAGE